MGNRGTTQIGAHSWLNDSKEQGCAFFPGHSVGDSEVIINVLNLLNMSASLSG